jgi:hypothetical protein
MAHSHREERIGQGISSYPTSVFPLFPPPLDTRRVSTRYHEKKEVKTNKICQFCLYPSIYYAYSSKDGRQIMPISLLIGVRTLSLLRSRHKNLLAIEE